MDSKAIIEALTAEKAEHDTAIQQAVRERQVLNASIKMHREELAKIDRLLKAAAGRAPKAPAAPTAAAAAAGGKVSRPASSAAA
jgi:hypothetical protein